MINTRPGMHEGRQLGADFSDVEAEEIANIARTQGWQVAAHDHMRSIDHNAYRLAIDEYSASLCYLLPLTELSRVLLLRCGWGAVALNLTSYVGSVTAMDDRSSRLDFVAARRKHIDMSRLRLILGSLDSELPFPAGAFDAVIMLDALEKSNTLHRGLANDSNSELLQEIGRVLVPDGWLLLGVPNRFSLIRRPSPSVQHLESYWGLRRMLRRVGFRNLQFYAPLPSHKEPFFILPLDQLRILNHFVDGMFTSQDYRSKLEQRGLSSVFRLVQVLWQVGRRLRLTFLARYFVPNFLVLAQKEGG